MNITRAQLKAQYERAKSRGWIPFFDEAAKTVTPGLFDTADLMGIGSRESNLDPKWLTKPGDNGNGFGLLQADKRSFPDFTKTEAWKDAKTGILFGAQVLLQKWNDLQNNVGKRMSVKSSKTGRLSYFTGPDAGDGSFAQKIAIASYNAGRWPSYAVSINRDPDTYTTGKDYSADVLARAKVFRELLANDSAVASVSSEQQAVNPTVDPQTSASSTADKPIETTVTRKEGDVVVEASKPNQQDVNQPAEVESPKPQGIFAKLTAGIGTLIGGTLLWQALEKIGQITFTHTAIAVVCFVVFIAFLAFCFWAWLDAWKQNNKTRLEAEAKTAIDRKDIVWR